MQLKQWWLIVTSLVDRKKCYTKEARHSTRIHRKIWTNMRRSFVTRITSQPTSILTLTSSISWIQQMPFRHESILETTSISREFTWHRAKTQCQSISFLSHSEKLPEELDIRLFAHWLRSRGWQLLQGSARWNTRTNYASLNYLIQQR